MKTRLCGKLCVLAQGLIFLMCVLLVTGESAVPSPNPKNDRPPSANYSVNNLDANKVSPPVIDVIHGKVNSVTHDIIGSLSEIPLVTEINNLTLEPVANKAEKLEATKLPENITLNSSSILIEHEHSSALYVDNVTLSPPSELNFSNDDSSDNDKPSPPLLDLPVDEEQLVRPPSSLEDKKEIPNLVTQEETGVDDASRSDHLVPTEPSSDTFIVKPPAKSPPPEPVDHKNASVEHHDDIPSFSEWAKKQMAEVEKNKGENLTVGTSLKMRLKNHASPDCGAKVVAANSEAISSSAILSPSRDDYMLSPCNVKIWFVVELCEVIQPQRLEIANFELFSSSPQDMSIYVSDRFPTREWGFVTTVQAKDERTVQSFSLPRVDLFAKYVKVELLSHYGSEHYCPVSLFKAFGTSELEILDNVDNASSDDDDETSLGEPTTSSPIDDEEERTLPTRTIKLEENNNPEKEAKGGDNLFGTAKKAVVSFMKKAAEVLVTGTEKNSTCSCPARSDYELPGYLIACGNRTEQYCRKLCSVLSCQMNVLSSYLKSRFVSSILASSPLCSLFGLESYLPVDEVSRSDGKYSVEMKYLRAFFPEETLAALCHVVASSPLEFLKNNSLETPSKIDAVEDYEVPEVNRVGEHVIVDAPEAGLMDALQNLSIEPTKTLTEENSTGHLANISLSGIASSTTTNDSQPGVQVPDDDNSSETVQPNEPSPAESTDEQSAPGITENENINDTETYIIPSLPATQIEPAQQVAAPSSQNESQHAGVNGFGGEASSLESIISELTDEEIRTVNPEGGDSSITSKSAVSNPPVAKESVFMRLANRIKALEVNISLSSQYLEELSRRYKRQVEELQRSLSSVVEERRLAAEREVIHEAQITALTAKVEALSDSIAQLLNEQNSWSPNFYVFKQHGFIIAIELVMLFLVVALCGWLTAQTKSPNDRARPAPQRRHSMDEIDSNSIQKMRRPSEEALIPSSATHQELLKDATRKTSRETRNNKRKRRRKDKTDDHPALDTQSVPLAVPSSSAGGAVTTLNATGEDETTTSLNHLFQNQSLTASSPYEPHPPAIPCPPPPSFFRTAQWTRKHRTSSIHTQTSSSRETVNSLTGSSMSSPSPSKKKPGAFKKIVKKFF